MTRVGGDDVSGFVFGRGPGWLWTGVKQGRGCWRLRETLLEVSAASCVESRRPDLRRAL